ncbi:MAG TPA: hypothetical protein VI384_02560 [Candidatus Dormibacteraeota bacterium]
MEARRTFVEPKSYRQLWIMLAAVLAAVVVAAGAVFIAEGRVSTGSPKAPAVTYPAPGTVLNQDKGKSTVPTVYSPKHRPTQF